MSLLMDALQRAEQDKTRAPGDHKVAAAPAVDETLELTLIDETEVETEVAPGAEPGTSENKSDDSGVPDRAYARQLTAAGRQSRRVRPWLLYGSGIILILFIIGAYYFWQLSRAPTDMLAVINIPATNPDKQALPPSNDSLTTHQPVPAQTTRTTPTAVQPRPPLAKPLSRHTPPSRQASKPAARSRQINSIHLRKRPQIDQTGNALKAAYEAYRNNRLMQADRLYGQVLQHLPRNRDALLGLAAISLRQNDKARAVRYYRKLAQLNPQDPIARPALIELTAGTDSPDAISKLREWIQTDPDNALLYFTLGNRYAGKARWQQAQNAYFRAYQLDPGNADFAFNLGVSLDRLNKKQLALNYYHQALSNASNRPSAFDRTQAGKRIASLENESRTSP